MLHLAVNYIMLQSVVKLSESSANAASPTNQFPLSCPVQRSQPLGRVPRCYYFSPHSSQPDTLQMQHVHQSLLEDFKASEWRVSIKRHPEIQKRLSGKWLHMQWWKSGLLYQIRRPTPPVGGEGNNISLLPVLSPSPLYNKARWDNKYPAETNSVLNRCDYED